MTTTTAPGLDTPIRRDASPGVVPNGNSPIKIWAAFGIVAVVFILYVWGKWVTGPFFTSTEPGPTKQPDWMGTVQTVWQIGGAIAAVALIWFLLARPWLRDRKLSTNGLFLIAYGFLWFQDPISTYFGTWMTYNANVPNKGNWVNEIPGWLGPGSPGAQFPEPPLFMAPLYLYVFVAAVAISCAAMRWARRKWPTLSKLSLLAVAFVAMMLFDLIIEAAIFMPLGFYTYAGAPMSIFPETYHKFPLFEGLVGGFTFAAVAGLRFFTNDKGETLVERGMTKIRVGPRRTLIRLFAIIAGTQIIFLGVNAPLAIMVGAHSTEWPKDIQERSYFTNGICGAGTDRACPGPGIPNTRGAGAIHLDPNGKLVVPKGAELPKEIPLTKKNNVEPFTGPLF